MRSRRSAEATTRSRAQPLQVPTSMYSMKRSRWPRSRANAASASMPASFTPFCTTQLSLSGAKPAAVAASIPASTSASSPRPPDSARNSAGSSVSRLTVTRRSPASRSARACAASSEPLVVRARSSMPSMRASRATSSGSRLRSSGSPPVSRSLRTPRLVKPRTRVSISSNDSRDAASMPWSSAIRSAGMQYGQRKLQASTSDSRRSRSGRASASRGDGGTASNSVAPAPGGVVGGAQAGEAGFDLVGATPSALLVQRALQPAQVALAPAGGRDAQARAVEVDHPAAAVFVEQDVVGIEVGMVQAGAVEKRDQLAGGLPRRLAFRGQRRQRAHALQPLHQDGGAVVQALAPVPGRERQRHRQFLRAQFAQQAELGEAAHPVDAAPQVGVAAEAGGQAAAQVLPQHRVALAGGDDPGAAAAALGQRP